MQMNKRTNKEKSNTLYIWGNKDSMNLNSMILTNIQSSQYFKKDLYQIKTYHEVIDEIYYRVKHLEPWEKGSRKTQGLTGMCGGVRGVGGGGIVSTAYCILYKLYTLKLTRKQVVGLLNHQDSPYIRGLGFMYIRYTQAPQDLFDWYDEYLDDEEEIDVKAGGGYVMTIGQMLKQWLTRLEWFDTLFPRIPVPIQNDISQSLRERCGASGGGAAAAIDYPDEYGGSRSNGGGQYKDLDAVGDDDEYEVNERHKRVSSNDGAESVTKKPRSRSRSRSRHRSHSSERQSHKHHKHSKHHKKHRSRSRSRERHGKHHRDRKSRSTSRSKTERRRREAS